MGSSDEDDDSLRPQPAWSLAVASWRRAVHDLYAAVRAEPDPVAAHAVWAAGRSVLFATHPASPRQPGQVLQHAAYDPAMRFELPMLPADPERWAPQTGTDGAVPFDRVGRFELPGLGSLDVWWLASYGNGFFVPLRDATAGRSTYGAGRYLLDTVKGADLGRADGRGGVSGPGERWVVDLNFAYNPSCTYDPAWACPLAPTGNRLAAEVPVGELLPAASPTPARPAR
ncbi:DUF1684 domain-containing protein [Lapillicoccus sp.]|uniref:DUF1684 domain-containing protein n=1 Tax=Lapillicoccus sp. TaxID=1909287 RepID=UPI0025F026EF|nr:DUF1684 domain-containing protein [Lapillicoccus sp.]